MTDGQSASLVLMSGTHLGPTTNFSYFFFLLLSLDCCRFVDVGVPSLMSLQFTVAAGPRQCSFFSGLSPAGLMTTFYYLNFETPPTWRVRFLYIFPPRNRITQLYPQALGKIPVRVKVRVKFELWPMVNWPVCFGVRLPSGTHDQTSVFCLTVVGFLMWGSLPKGWVCDSYTDSKSNSEF
jgi:hypothetical protein